MFKSKIKSQYDLQTAVSSVSLNDPSNFKRAKSTAGNRRTKKNLNTFDIQVRSYNYKGVPDLSEVQF